MAGFPPCPRHSQSPLQPVSESRASSCPSRSRESLSAPTSALNRASFHTLWVTDDARLRRRLHGVEPVLRLRGDPTDAAMQRVFRERRPCLRSTGPAPARAPVARLPAARSLRRLDMSFEPEPSGGGVALGRAEAHVRQVKVFLEARCKFDSTESTERKSASDARFLSRVCMPATVARRMSRQWTRKATLNTVRPAATASGERLSASTIASRFLQMDVRALPQPFHGLKATSGSRLNR